MYNNSILTGIAGVYYVAAELTIRGFNASALLRNSEYYDILAVNQSEHKQILIQVKTSWNHRGGRKWILNEKVEGLSISNLFFIFVNIVIENEDTSKVKPEFFIINSIELSNKIKKEYDEWLTSPGRGGKKRNPNKLRQFSDKEGYYKDKWHILKE